MLPLNALQSHRMSKESKSLSWSKCGDLQMEQLGIQFLDKF